MAVQILEEVGLAREAASEFVGVHIGECALLGCDCLRVDHL